MCFSEASVRLLVGPDSAVNKVLALASKGSYRRPTKLPLAPLYSNCSS
jgi:hypothetical protein